ncbi:putative splicing factor,arginine/serine-rich [Trichinella pseudospiralis]
MKLMNFNLRIVCYYCIVVLLYDWTDFVCCVFEFLDWSWGLPERASRGELEEIFGRFGPLRNVWVARRPWGFAFVEFEDARDAIDAVRQLDGSRMCGVRARVELSHGQRRNRGPRGYDDERRGGDRRRTPPRRSRSGSYRRSRSPSRKRYRSRS